MWFLEFLKAFGEKFVEELKIGNIGEEINHGTSVEAVFHDR